MYTTLENLIFFPVFSLERTHKKHLVNQKKSNKEGKIMRINSYKNEINTDTT
jgi:hypothetical protein